MSIGSGTTREPPAAAERVAGGLIGVVGGEAWHRGSGHVGKGPVSEALFGLCRAYIEDPGGGAAVEVATRHEGVPGVAWLLPVAFVEREARSRQRRTRELALTAGLGTHAVSACVAYVELAARLFAAEGTVQAAVRAATGRPAPAPAPRPPLVGVGAADGLAAATWALGRPDQLAGILWMLVESGEKEVAPWVAAAAAGLLGVRDGRSAVPARWHGVLEPDQHEACLEQAAALVGSVVDLDGQHVVERHAEVVS